MQILFKHALQMRRETYLLPSIAPTNCHRKFLIKIEHTHTHSQLLFIELFQCYLLCNCLLFQILRKIKQENFERKIIASRCIKNNHPYVNNLFQHNDHRMQFIAKKCFMHTTETFFKKCKKNCSCSP